MARTGKPREKGKKEFVINTICIIDRKPEHDFNIIFVVCIIIFNLQRQLENIYNTL